jgi:hypothetical protein
VDIRGQDLRPYGNFENWSKDFMGRGGMGFRKPWKRDKSMNLGNCSEGGLSKDRIPKFTALIFSLLGKGD